MSDEYAVLACANFTWRHCTLFTLPREFIPAANRSMFVQTVSFVGMVIHRDLLTTSLDHIHEQLFIYFDDLYFGYQLSLAGEKIMYSPELLFIMM